MSLYPVSALPSLSSSCTRTGRGRRPRPRCRRMWTRESSTASPVRGIPTVWRSAGRVGPSCRRRAGFAGCCPVAYS
jgi:hypothetical protein